MIFFSIYDGKQRSYREKNRFRTAASLGACERLDALIIDARRQYILLVIIIITQVLTRHCIIVNIIA